VVWASARCGKRKLSTSRLIVGGIFVGLMPKLNLGAMGVKQIFKPNSHRRSTVQADLQRKLDPRRFHWTCQTLASVVGFILGTSYCIPVIDQLTVVYDGVVIARIYGSQKTSNLGQYDDLERRWNFLLSSAGLTKDERIAAESLFATKIGHPFDALN
jgi:hypothetical protein